MTTDTSKTLYLIRGLPGSGKTTLGRLLVGPFRMVAADDYFMVQGEYRFDPARLPEAHVHCQYVCRFLMGTTGQPVAVTNTFTRQWELAPYHQMAAAHGYQVVELTVESGLTDEALSHRCVHGVPAATITAMRNRWELTLPAQPSSAPEIPDARPSGTTPATAAPEAGESS